MNGEKLARKSVQTLMPYQSARRLGSSGDIWLNANESPFSNKYQVSCDRLNRYGACQPDELVEAYAHYAGVKKEKILTCRGADEGIDLLIRTFCEPGQDSILYCPPTYGMYGISAQTVGVAVKALPKTADWQLDIPLIRKNLDSVKLVFICNPNNPTGNLIQPQAIKALLDMTYSKALVVVDEAYIDFCPEASSVQLLNEYPNLVILRTLSKAFALAGLRCGFVLAHADIIQLLLKVIAPYPVPVPVEEIATQALSDHGVKTTKSQVEVLRANHVYLAEKLSEFNGVTVYESVGNFLLVQFPDSEQVFSCLWNQGITVRHSPIHQCLRISIGSREECEELVAAIESQLK
ncbi:histidinol-phosphate transaminase [Endozoicomonas sp. Mp262]|uniref:histidinol-phosphate transaminase n=1 Tax=Endozoicomonas sp. Mp262 TaxID=2919499 RepID=UPI0021D7FF9C